MLVIVGVIVALVVTAGADVLEFSEEALKLLQLSDYTDEVKRSAQLINPDIGLILRFEKIQPRQNSIVMNPVTFYMVTWRDHPVCRYDTGISIANGPTACKIENIRIHVDKKDDVHSIQIICKLRLEDPPTSSPFEIIIPVMTPPPTFPPPSPHNLNSQYRWGFKNQAGVTPPFCESELEKIGRDEDADVWVNIDWLFELLFYGVFNLKNDEGTDRVVLKPVLLSKSFVQKLIELVQP